MESHACRATNRSQPHQSFDQENGRHKSPKGNKNVKHAILAKVISVKKQSRCSVAVRLESEELRDEAVIVSTGLDGERTHIKSPGGGLEVTCKGDPRADVGDAVPVVVELQPRN